MRQFWGCAEYLLCHFLGLYGECNNLSMVNLKLLFNDGCSVRSYNSWLIVFIGVSYVC